MTWLWFNLKPLAKPGLLNSHLSPFSKSSVMVPPSLAKTLWVTRRHLSSCQLTKESAALLYLLGVPVQLQEEEFSVIIQLVLSVTNSSSSPELWHSAHPEQTGVVPAAPVTGANNLKVHLQALQKAPVIDSPELGWHQPQTRNLLSLQHENRCTSYQKGRNLHSLKQISHNLII